MDMQEGTKYNESDDFNLSTCRNACTTCWSEESWEKSATAAGENQMFGFYFNVAFRRPNGDTE